MVGSGRALTLANTLAVDTQGGVRSGLEALGWDLLAALLADAIEALRLPFERAWRMLRMTSRRCMIFAVFGKCSETR